MHRHCLVLFAEGSRDPRWRLPFERMRRDLEPGADVVRLAFLKDSEPNLLTVVRECYRDGVRSVGLLPLYLVGSEEAVRALECILEEVRSLYPEMLPPEGRHPRSLVRACCGASRQ